MIDPTNIARIILEQFSAGSSGSVDGNQSGTIKIYAGNALRLDVIYTVNGTCLNDADITGLTAEIFASPLSGASYCVEATAGANTNCSVAAFSADQPGTPATANWSVQFSNADIALLPAGTDTAPAQYVIIFYFGEQTLGQVNLAVYPTSIPGSASPGQAGNLVPAATNYSGAGAYTLAVNEGSWYLIYLGANDTSFVNGTQTVNTTPSLTFIQAQGDTITLHGTDSAAITAAVMPNALVNVAMVLAILAANAGNVFNDAWFKASDNYYYKATALIVNGVVTWNIDPTTKTLTPSG